MDRKQKQDIIKKFKDWFKDSIITNHKKNTEKLVDINIFKINPFLLYYLSNYFKGNSDADSLAKVLLYPRVLGTSITTSFGTHMQKFTTQVLSAYSSTTKGMDIEFIDQIDNRRKYCQLKSGPDALNNDDVETYYNHFQDLIHLARTNNLRIEYGDLVFALSYGERDEINSFIKKLEHKNITILVGQEFWHRFTGDEKFYYHLIKAAGEIANDINMKEVVESVISQVSTKIEERFKELYNN